MRSRPRPSPLLLSRGRFGAVAHTQRGFLLIVAVVMIVSVALLATVITFLSAGNVLSGASHASSAQALFIAEAGLEQGARKFSLNSAYTGETDTPFANGSFTVTVSTTNFSGNTLPSRHIRLRSVGQVSGSGVLRSAETIVGPENLLPLSANADFNLPETCVYPTCLNPDYWLLNPTPTGAFVPWVNGGGPEAAPTRSAYAEKPSPGSSTATSAGSFTFTTPIVVTAPTTMQMSFDYKVVSSGSTNKEMQLTFTLTDGTTIWTAPRFDSGNTGTYQSGSVTFTITGTGTKSITKLGFDLFLVAGQPKYAWLDNLVLTQGTGPVQMQVKAWREVFP